MQVLRFNASTIRRIAGGVAVVALMAPRPFTPGVTYKVRMSTKFPDFAAAFGAGAGGGALAGGAIVLAKATAAGGRARLEFQAMEPANAAVLPDDYLLVTDSGTMITVSPDSRTYRDGSAVAGGLTGLASMGGRGGGGGIRLGGGGGGGGFGGGGGGGGGGFGGGGGGGGGAGGGPPGAGAGGAPGGNALDGFQVRDVHIDLQKLGAGEAFDGRPTQHYMISTEYSAMIGGELRPLHITMEVWTAKIPAGVVNPFDQLGGGAYDKSGPTVELMAKLDATRRQLDGSPVKTVTTIPIGDLMAAFAAGGGGGGGGAGGAGGRGIDLGAAMAGLTIVQTLQVTGITEMDVDPKLLAIPDGYTKK